MYGALYVFQRDEGGADNWLEVTRLLFAFAHDLSDASAVAVSEELGWQTLADDMAV